ncbi:MAG: DUF1080 domain-containing protein [Armatimonadetes bacterium]|nr:DUF1080 domain-containing protein [Armatimonadota bacterium]
MSVAYDATNCNLYKVWDGQSQNPFLVMPPEAPTWRVRTGSELYDAKPKWKGYRIKTGRVTIDFEMMIEGVKVSVHETPTLVRNAGGWIGIERSFSVENLPASAALMVDVPIPNANGRTTTNGSLAPATELENPSLQENRVLTLRPKGTTFLRTFPEFSSTKQATPLDPPFVSQKKPDTTPVQEQVVRRRPGDQRPLDSVHPSYNLTAIRTPEFKSGISGMDFSSNGDLILCTSDGNVYRIANFKAGAASTIKSKLIARGLGTPHGLRVVGSKVFVLQKSELTELVDSDKDGETDQYNCISTGWDISPSLQDFANGLIYKDNRFYSLSNPSPNRLQLLKTDLAGMYESTDTALSNSGCISVGSKGEMFLSAPGQISQAMGTKEQQSLPIVWIPKELSPNPTEAVQITSGAKVGQLLFGDGTVGGLSRVSMEKVNGILQGCVFRAFQGLGAITTRIILGVDGSLYAGGDSLCRLKPNVALAFEIQSVKLKTNGLQVTLNQSLMDGMGTSFADYEVMQYEPGHESDGETLPVQSVTLNKWRNQIFLEVPGIQAERIVHLRLNPGLSSTADLPLWSTEAWYSVHSIPTNQMVSIPPLSNKQNVLTSDEVKEGFKLLFDGESLKNFRGFNKPEPTPGWTVKDGEIEYVPGQNDVDLMSREEFDDFELRLDWKICKGGNSGIMFRVAENQPATYTTGPEMQILDNDNHPDGKSLLTSAGSSYGLFPVKRETQRLSGQWNNIRIVAIGNKIEFWMNGYRVVQYTINSPLWKEKIKTAWFANPLYGQMKSGHISLQNHGNNVWFRNLRIRQIKTGHSLSR